MGYGLHLTQCCLATIVSLAVFPSIPNRHSPKRKTARRRVVTTNRIVSGTAEVLALMRPPAQRICTVHKLTDEQRLQQAATAQLSNIFFTAAQANFAPFLSAFQQFRIVKVEAMFRPCFRANQVGASYEMPLIYIAVDPNDSVNWATIADAQSAENVAVMDDSAPFAVILRPGLIMPGQNAGGFGAPVTLNEVPWVDCDEDATRFYGVKTAVSAAGAATALQEWVYQARLTVEFRIGR